MDNRRTVDGPDLEGVIARHGAALGDVPALVQEVWRLRTALGEIAVLLRALHQARMRAANLEAAGRATLAADRDGEADPLFYLRDELAVSR